MTNEDIEHRLRGMRAYAKMGEKQSESEYAALAELLTLRKLVEEKDREFYNLGQHSAEQIDKVGNHGEEVARELSEMLDAAKDEIAVLRLLATEMRSHLCFNKRGTDDLAARFDALRKEWEP